jgi:hypothetical protein
VNVLGDNIGTIKIIQTLIDTSKEVGQEAVSVAICYLKRSDIKYTSMPYPICQHMVNLVVCLSDRR